MMSIRRLYDEPKEVIYARSVRTEIEKPAGGRPLLGPAKKYICMFLDQTIKFRSKD